jgi:hypothetical protein
MSTASSTDWETPELPKRVEAGGFAGAASRTLGVDPRLPGTALFAPAVAAPSGRAEPSEPDPPALPVRGDVPGEERDPAAAGSDADDALGPGEAIGAVAEPEPIQPGTSGRDVRACGSLETDVGSVSNSSPSDSRAAARAALATTARGAPAARGEDNAEGGEAFGEGCVLTEGAASAGKRAPEEAPAAGPLAAAGDPPAAGPLAGASAGAPGDVGERGAFGAGRDALEFCCPLPSR